jgi:transcription antitermination factor NusG
LQNVLDLPTANALRCGGSPSPLPPVPPKPLRQFCTATRGYPGLGTTPPSRLPPPSLPEGVQSVAEIAEGWFAIHSRVDYRGSNDAALAWSLFLAGIPFYYPQVQHWVMSGISNPIRRRKNRSLFNGYVFSAGDAAEKYCRDDKQRPLVECILHEHFVGQLAHDLSLIQVAVQEDPELTTDKLDRPGTKVRVKYGPFMNYEGEVDFSSVKGERVIVHCHITFMNRSLPKEFDVSDLERI